jgi:hypothetical protein
MQGHSCKPVMLNAPFFLFEKIFYGRTIRLFVNRHAWYKPKHMELIKPKIRFDNSGYYFIGLLALVLLGFWPSYFSKFFSSKTSFTFYFHFHAIMMALWIAALVVQPIVITCSILPAKKTN